MVKPSWKPKVFLLDVDGVMTTGHFLYSEDGKVFKIFGPDDNDALSLISAHLNVVFITADKKGFPISRKRIVEDMKYPLHLVPSLKRVDWIQDNFSPSEVVYMGDGIFDHYVMKEVGYSISPSNSSTTAKNFSNYTTTRSGGDRAVAEACLHLLDKFFTPYNPTVGLNSPNGGLA